MISWNLNFWKQVKPRYSEKKQQKEDFLKNLYNLSDDRGRVHHAFDSKIFPIKIGGTGFLDHSNLKIINSK